VFLDLIEDRLQLHPVCSVGVLKLRNSKRTETATGCTCLSSPLHRTGEPLPPSPSHRPHPCRGDAKMKAVGRPPSVEPELSF
jgi:hypothetical protein